MHQLNNDLKLLAEGQFPERGPDLFGKSVWDLAQAKDNSIKALKVCNPRSVFPGAEAKNTSTRVAMGISQSKSSKVSIQVPRRWVLPFEISSCPSHVSESHPFLSS